MALPDGTHCFLHTRRARQRLQTYNWGLLTVGIGPCQASPLSEEEERRGPEVWPLPFCVASDKPHLLSGPHLGFHQMSGSVQCKSRCEGAGALVLGRA